MEKFENMQQNRIADEELNEITGGRGIRDIFTAEFWGKAGDATTLKMDPEDEKNNFSVSTLEMRSNVLDKQDKDNNRNVVKL